MKVVKKVGHWAFMGGCVFTNERRMISVVWDIGDNGINQLLLLQNRYRDKHSEK